MWRAWQINERGADYLQHPKWSILIIRTCCIISCCCPWWNQECVPSWFWFVSKINFEHNKSRNCCDVGNMSNARNFPYESLRLLGEGKSQRAFVVRVLGREVLAPPCASWLTRHPERDPLPVLLLLLLPTTTMSWTSNVAFFVVGPNLLAIYLTKYYIP